MILEGKKVGVIGGSIAGCAAAVALARAGAKPQIFERSAHGLRDRGSGIAIPNPLRDKLEAAHYLPGEYTTKPMRERWWVLPDGTANGRRVWTQATPAASNNWGVLWGGLRAQLPDEIYHTGKVLVDLIEDADGVGAVFGDGTRDRFDLVVGADGYHSAVRGHVCATVEPDYAGYILWRGNYPESRVRDRALIDAIDTRDAWLTVPFPGGHAVLYPIPGFDGSIEPGQRRINWAIYAPTPTCLKLKGVESFAPGHVEPEVYVDLKALIDNHFPRAFGELISESTREEVSIQPVFDAVMPTYVSKRILLIGDAGTTPRPHTASGATKALEDAMALERLAHEVGSLEDLMTAYDYERCTEAARVAKVGRMIGRAQVEATPDWPAMSEDDFERWHAGMLSGETLYLYGDKTRKSA